MVLPPLLSFIRGSIIVVNLLNELRTDLSLFSIVLEKRALWGVRFSTVGSDNPTDSINFNGVYVIGSDTAVANVVWLQVLATLSHRGEDRIIHFANASNSC